MQTKKFAFGLVLTGMVALLLAAVWGAGEAYCRKLYGEMDTDNVAANQSKGFFAFCPSLGWRGHPNVSMRHNSGAWVTQNEHGFRDAPWDLDAKKPRVLLLGDSNMWGFGVNDDEYPAALLNRAYSRVRWFNGGMNGYGTDQQYLLFQELKPKIKPDLTVLVVCGNDRSENTSRRVRGYNKPYFDWDGRSLSLRNSPVPAPDKTDALWVSAPDELFRKTGSYLLYHLAQIAEARKNRARGEAETLDKQIKGSSAQDPTEALVRELHREAEGHLLVVLISSDPGISSTCEREGIPIMDMGETPVGQPGPFTYPSGRPKYGHWTPAGNRIAAALIGDAALRQLAALGIDTSEPVPGDPHVLVANETGIDLMEIRWIDGEGKDWGDQIFQGDSLLANAVAAVMLPPGVREGSFRVLAIDADGKEIAWPSQTVREGQVVVLRKP